MKKGKELVARIKVSLNSFFITLSEYSFFTNSFNFYIIKINKPEIKWLYDSLFIIHILLYNKFKYY